MNGLGLSAEQLSERRRYICASDASKIMAGEWRGVWREKRGLADGDDLSGKLPVQLGSYSEPFNLAWYEQVTGRAVEYYSASPLMQSIWLSLSGRPAVARELVVSKNIPFMACNLDALSTTARGYRCVLDAKHVGRADDPMILRYTAAGTHQALVCGTDWWALSVLIGNNKHEVIEQEVDPFYAEELIARETEFWGYVERGEEPEDRIEEPVAAPKPQPRLRIVQLDDDFKAEWPNWGADMVELFGTFAATHHAFIRHNIARDGIKKLLPDDVGEVTRGRIRVHRDKGGAIRMNIEKEKGEQS